MAGPKGLKLASIISHQNQARNVYFNDLKDMVARRTSVMNVGAPKSANRDVHKRYRAYNPESVLSLPRGRGIGPDLRRHPSSERMTINYQC